MQRQSSATAAAAPRRTTADFAVIALELSRAMRGFRYYDALDTRRRALADRAHRALQAELERSGPLTLEVCDEGLRDAEHRDEPESGAAVRELADVLRGRGLLRIRLDRSLTRDALTGLLDLLGRPDERYATPDGLAHALAARDDRGIRLNDAVGAATPPTRKLSTTPLHAAVTLDEPTTSDDTRSPTPSSASAPETPSLARDPLGRHADDEWGERLRARLIELDRMTDDRAYASRAAEIVTWAMDLWREGLVDECYRAMLVLADHAVGAGGRSEEQARIAAERFRELAAGPRLAELIERATGAGHDGVRAAQLLVQLGEASVPALLARICQEPEGDAAGPLRALVLTLGDAAIPTLRAAIDSADELRGCLALRLAGELQNPALLEAVLEASTIGSVERRVAAIRALGFLPGEAGREAIARALRSEEEAVVIAASQAVARIQDRVAVPKLLELLESTLHTRRTRLGCTLVHVLGRIGDERAVPRLVAILERRPLVRRAHWHALQIAVVDALALLPVKEARRSLERAANGADAPVRDRARQRLGLADPTPRHAAGPRQDEPADATPTAVEREPTRVAAAGRGGTGDAAAR
ncbi:MAG: HEAT repeat domain-containing protein [Spirochaetaceae bacterium]|nr:HEAT repeat domain-containing protein [Myxococcales bacterium]MCB9723385.1 HEAT repeat domain-containing protein [Spirochaetaceae bacterium]